MWRKKEIPISYGVSRASARQQFYKIDIAVFLHDSGYIRKKGDCSGTGAKYTFRHIDRSVDFARIYLSCLGYQEQDLVRVDHMIKCTGVKPKLEQINFVSEGCRLLGYALGPADLLSQMAEQPPLIGV